MTERTDRRSEAVRIGDREATVELYTDRCERGRKRHVVALNGEIVSTTPPFSDGREIWLSRRDFFRVRTALRVLARTEGTP